MRKRRFSIFILCIILCLSACVIAACGKRGNNASLPETVITNKSALTADWYITSPTFKELNDTTIAKFSGTKTIKHEVVK